MQSGLIFTKFRSLSLEIAIKATKSAFKGHALPARFGDHGFWLATIGVYHAMGVSFAGIFFATGDKWGYLCQGQFVDIP